MSRRRRRDASPSPQDRAETAIMDRVAFALGFDRRWPWRTFWNDVEWRLLNLPLELFPSPAQMREWFHWQPLSVELEHLEAHNRPRLQPEHCFLAVADHHLPRDITHVLGEYLGVTWQPEVEQALRQRPLVPVEPILERLDTVRQQKQTHLARLAALPQPSDLAVAFVVSLLPPAPLCGFVSSFWHVDADARFCRQLRDHPQHPRNQVVNVFQLEFDGAVLQAFANELVDRVQKVSPRFSPPVPWATQVKFALQQSAALMERCEHWVVMPAAQQFWRLTQQLEDPKPLWAALNQEARSLLLG